MTGVRYEAGQRIAAGYYASVYKPNIGGWRSEWVEAELEVISPGRAKVVSCHIEEATSRRQDFSVSRAEADQIGAVKIISKLSNVRVVGDE